MEYKKMQEEYQKLASKLDVKLDQFWGDSTPYMRNIMRLPNTGKRIAFEASWNDRELANQITAMAENNDYKDIHLEVKGRWLVPWCSNYDELDKRYSILDDGDALYAEDEIIQPLIPHLEEVMSIAESVYESLEDPEEMQYVQKVKKDCELLLSALKE